MTYISRLFNVIIRKHILVIPTLLFAVLICIYSVFIQKEEQSDTFTDCRLRITFVQERLSGDRVYYGTISNGRRYLIKTDSELYLGEVLICDGSILNIDGPTNPGEFDYKDYLKRKGITNTIEIHTIKQSSRSNLYETFFTIKYFLRNKVYELMSSRIASEDLSIVSAMCLGDSSLIEQEIVRNFKLANCSHILAVSGSHFSSFLVVIPFVIDICKINRRRTKSIYTILIIILGFITGWSESVTRASFMSLCNVFSRDRISGMCFAALIMMIANPYCILSIGCQISFVITTMLITSSSDLSLFIQEYIDSKKISDILSVQLTSFIGILPFTYKLGYSFGIITFLAQILAGVLINLICIFAITGFLLSWMGASVFFPTIYCCRILVKFVSFVSQFYYQQLNGRQIGKYTGLILFVLLVIVIHRIKTRYSKLIAMFLALSLVINMTNGFIQRDNVRIIFLDVGQGDACLIFDKDISLLIDTGTYYEGEYIIPNVLDYYKIKKLDYLIVSHWDADHSGYVNKLMLDSRVEHFLTSYDDDEIESLEVRAGDAFQLSKNIRMEVIWPLRAYEGSNNESVVCYLSVFDYKLLFTGDIDKTCEEQISWDDIDILKVSHHGSKYSTSEEFLESTLPEISIISCGENNNYGHPSNEVITNLAKIGSSVYRTDKDGAIEFNVSKNGFSVKCYS